MTPKPLYILIILFSLMLTGCGEDPQPVQKAASQPASAAPAPQPSAPSPPQKEETRATWPFMHAGEPAGVLADNLTAKNYLLIFDGSGSMRESKCAGASRKIDVAKQAVVTWSKSVPANANLGLYAFHNNGILTLPMASGQRDGFMQAVDQIMAGGNTPLSKAMLYAYDSLTKQGRRQLGYGEYTIVVVTDGIANSIENLQKVADHILSKTPITIYSIGFCIGEHHSLNQPGRTMYKSADNPDQLKEGLREVLAESEAFDEQEFSK
jgi:hypothetical protein